jgi:hypothetical protein
MCSFGGGPKAPPPPPPPDPSIEEEAKAKRRRERMKLQSETSALKQEQYEQRVNAAYGRTGRRSLLSGSKGGRGYALEPRLMSKTTLGA